MKLFPSNQLTVVKYSAGVIVMSQNSTEEFWQYLLQKYSTPAGAGVRNKADRPAKGELTLRTILGLDCAAGRRLRQRGGAFLATSAAQPAPAAGRARPGGKILPPLPAANPQFSRSPAADGSKLAMADPTDTAALRAAEIVLGGPVEIVVASFEDIATVLGERLGDDEAEASAAADVARAAFRRRHRKPARSRQRRAGGARAQRPVRARGRAARQRHPHRAVPHRPRGAHAGRRPAAQRAGADRRAAAGADLAHQDPGRPQHRRAAAAAGRRRAGARRPHRDRHPRRHHADPARRIGGASACCRATAACSTSASSASRRSDEPKLMRSCWRCRTA